MFPFPSNLHNAAAWSRSCDIAVQAYHLLSAVDDKAFAHRVIQTAFTLPEIIAAALTHSHTHAPALNRGRETLAVLQTQLFLAAECGLLPRPSMSALNLETDVLARELQNRVASTA